MRVPLTVAAIHQAIAEFDELGREAFLHTYGFGMAKDYMLVVDRKEYDSKAIVAVAHKYLPGDGQPLKHDELSGGVGDAVRKLMDLNFVVERRSARIDWTWDEHVLALELYMVNPASPPSKTSAQVIAVSELLNRLGERRGIDRSETYRNANGVYMKMMNFRRFDPAFQAAGKSGLPQATAWKRRSGTLSHSTDLPWLKQRTRSGLRSPTMRSRFHRSRMISRQRKAG